MERKLSEAFVASVLKELGVEGFSLLAPDGSGYTLYASSPPSAAAPGRNALAANIHYRWAVQVGTASPRAELPCQRGWWPAVR